MLNTVTGNRVILKIDGQPIGLGTQSVAVHDDYGLQEVDGIGQSESQELVYGKASYTINVSRFFVPADMLRDKPAALNGGVPLAPVLTMDETIFTSGELDIEILDVISGTTLELYTGCKMASGNRNYGKHTIVVEDAVFRAIHKAK